MGRTSPVGVFKKGDTPDGISDMAGNVWEWTDSWYDEAKKRKVLRGGSWYLFRDYCRCACRNYIHPYDWYYSVGFRLSRTL
ncbi:MAG: formylglycine-generating enzyme family protein [Thermodesulfobacteriota bacterium]